MAKRKSCFDIDAEARQKEQQTIENKIMGKMEPIRNRKVPMNITLPLEYKEKLQAYAKERNISASILIQMWIDEKCV